MKLSTKGRYGIRALIDLAVNSQNGHVSLVQIANRNQISLHYLEHVFANLKKSGIVKSVKGAQGGYTLAERPEKITLAQIMLAVEGDFLLELEESSEDNTANAMSEAMNELLWSCINEETKKILERVTLADLVQRYMEIAAVGLDMYYI